MLGSLLKAAGVILLISAFIALFVGGVAFLLGNPDVGRAVMGSCLLVAGMGLAFLVAGIAAGGRRQGLGHQQQQVVVANPTNAPPRVQ